MFRSTDVLRRLSLFSFATLVLASSALCLAQGPRRAAAPPAAQSLTAPPATAAFRVLDNVEGPWINLNVVPVRPMLLTADGGHLYAVNTHGNTVVHFDNASGQPSQTFGVPWGPVSIAQWISAAGGGSDELLVVCRGTHALARLDRLSGKILRCLDLPFEPGDILVNAATNRAFVSCSGADSVVEIDLPANTIAHTYKIPAKHPLFLSFDGAGKVLVAPLFSGNNAAAIAAPPGSIQSSFLGILDLATSPFVVQPLPDQDLFRIDPVAETVTAAATATGTVLFQQAENPLTHKIWQLNTEAINTDPSKQSEPSLRGVFVDNRLTIIDPAAPDGPHTFVNLDDSVPSTPAIDYDPTKAVGQPYALTFTTSGYGLIAGLLTDNVTIATPQGVPFFEWNLAPGSIPRQTLLDNSGQLVFVYCWGTNKIDTYVLVPNPAVVLSLDLGLDPAPKLVKQGRAIFYAGANSLHGNLSCATCHVEGRTDMELWNLSNLPYDDKGPLVTQTLAGIEKLAPFHWRGERVGLIDFNPAFDKLLGGAELDTTPGAAFDQFQRFAFSVVNPANINEAPARVVSDAFGTNPPPGYPVSTASAVTGQDKFFDGNQDGVSCNRCHTLPTGTSNDIVADGLIDPQPHRKNVKIPPFNEMWRKEQPVVPVKFINNISLDYALLGAGLTHAGLSNTLFDFVDDVFAIPDQETADIVKFVSQVDQGLAPGVHRCALLNLATYLVNKPVVKDFLLPQAQQRNIDLVAFGSVTLGAAQVKLRWAWNRTSGLFDCEDNTVPSKTLDFFLGQARVGLADNLFVGVPVGMGRNFAIDIDGDGLTNLNEAAHGTSPVIADSDNDGFSDGYEVDHGSNPADATSLPTDNTPPQISNLHLGWITGKVARLFWDTDERTSFSIAYSTNGDPSLVVSGNDLKKTNTALLTQMKPSSGTAGSFTYAGTLTVTDERGNTTTVPLPNGLKTGDFFFFADAAGAPAPPFITILGNLRWTQISKVVSTGAMTAKAVARVDHKMILPIGPTAANQVVIGSVIVNDVRISNFTSPLPKTFTIFGQPPGFGGAAFVMSNVTPSNGLAMLEFTIPGGLAVGDDVTLNMEAVAIVDPAIYNPQQPNFGDAVNVVPMGLWSFPDTPKANRSLVAEF